MFEYKYDKTNALLANKTRLGSLSQAFKDVLAKLSCLLPSYQ
jgi:hypothetical protein